MRNWTDYPGRKGIVDSLTYWSGRDAWVAREYREGRLFAAYLIGNFRDKMLDAAILNKVVSALSHGSEYYNFGAVTLLNTWFTRYGSK